MQSSGVRRLPPWQSYKGPMENKRKNNTGNFHPITAPGQCISLDQLELTTAGFIAQLKGRATRNRYKYVTIFVDHFSGHSFTYLQKRITLDETQHAKVAYEAYAKSLGITIKHYHADNGHFADNAFLKSVMDCHQMISFCGVNGHFQNRQAEKKIRDLQDLARTQLIHAKYQRPAAVKVALWPYALWHANNVHIPKTHLPAGETILPAIWSMRRKRCIAMREVYKWKSHLTLGRHKMIKGKHYDEMYAPSLSWGTIRLFLILSIMHGWKSRQLDFILAYPHADIPCLTFMELPRGINFSGRVHRNKHCLCLKKNIYSGKDSG